MVTILHAADLHLDSPFGALPREQAAMCRARQRELPELLVQRCSDLACDLLLLAGDIFDGTPHPETVEALQNALGRCHAEVFIAPGNHDPYTAGSVWANTNWPKNVHIFTGEMTSISLPHLQCRIWGAAFQDREAEALLRPIPAADDGFLEIGVFHGDPLNRGPYHHIPPHVLQDCGLDYLALGHIHQRFGPKWQGRTFYAWPGTAMGRGFDECGEKGGLHIQLEKGRCEGTFVPLPAPRFEILTLPAQAPILPPGTENLLCRLILTGDSDPVDCAAVTAALSPRFLFLEVRDETLPLRDLWDGAGAPTLRGMALAHLKAQHDCADTEQSRQTIRQAARFLLSALEGRVPPCEFCE